MPSNSNVNKMHLPANIPVGRICVPVSLPDDPEYIALFTGAIYRLAQQIWYDRDPEKRARDVAAVWHSVYVDLMTAFRTGVFCETDPGDVCMFDVRVNPEDECEVQKTFDGVEWERAFRLDDCWKQNIIRNPETGFQGWSDGTTFYRFPDGPWGESRYPTFSTPLPRPESTEASRECAAAANAAFAISMLYRRVAETLLDEIASDWENAAAIGTSLSGFLLAIGAAASQPYVAVASILSVVGVHQQYVDSPLDGDDEERLKCIFLDNAQSSGDSVTFNYDGVFNAIDLNSPKNGLVRFLMIMIGPDAVNAGGAIQAVASPNCAECLGLWCHTFNFVASQDGWVPFVWGGTPFANYISSFGWGYIQAASPGSVYSRASFIELEFPSSAIVTSVLVNYRRDAGSFNATADAFTITRNASGDLLTRSNLTVNNGAPTSELWEGEQVFNLGDTLQVQVRSSRQSSAVYSGYAAIYSIVIEGTGTNPFTDNC